MASTLVHNVPGKKLMDTMMGCDNLGYSYCPQCTKPEHDLCSWIQPVRCNSCGNEIPEKTLVEGKGTVEHFACKIF